jgi:DNA topoisomerase-2
MADRTSKYRKLTPLQHVTERPGMYVGAVAHAETTQWIASVSDGAVEMRRTLVDFVPALFKLFDETISNALDASVKDLTVKNIWVNISERTLNVRNDGAGITVDVHPETGMRVPELIFSQLLAGENFSDDDRTVAGQNGLGVKLCNIFSKSFTAKVRDGQTGSVWECTWCDGMTRAGKPVLKLKDKPAGGFVDVLFEPLPLMLQPSGNIAPGVQALLQRRAVDVALAARPGVRVTINDVKLPEMTLKRYAQLYVGPAVFLATDEQATWRVALAASSSPTVVGLVNGVSAGGVHIEHVERRLYSAVLELLKTKRDAKVGAPPPHPRPQRSRWAGCVY